MAPSPLIHLRLRREYTGAAPVQVASYWKALEPFPSLNGAHGPIEVSRNRFPRIKSRHRRVPTEITNRRAESNRTDIEGHARRSAEPDYFEIFRRYASSLSFS